MLTSPPLTPAASVRRTAHPHRRRTSCAGPRRQRTVAAAAASDDFYAVLGVDRSADAKALKSAYRKLALQYHPDVNKAPDAADRFRRIKTAYTTLADPAARAQYNARGGGSQSRAGGFDYGGFGAGSGASGSGRSAERAPDFYGLGDFFRDLDKELASERRGSKGGPRSGREKTLMEELAELGASVGEELVEFLEMGLAGLEDETAGKTQAAKAEGARSSAAARAAGEAAGAAARAAGAAAARGAEQSVEEQLRQMKRDMGLE